MLVEELKTMGMHEVTMDENGYVMATLPSNTEKEVPTIGFFAHVDTATDFTGKNVNPQIVENYDGHDIVLKRSITSRPFYKKISQSWLTIKDIHSLQQMAPPFLVLTTKQALAEIMTAMDYLIKHPEIKHGKIRVAFTPDEEIGRGPHKFDVDAFNAAYAYTMDGGPLGELEYESFNAAAAKITVKGTNVHPGTAKGKMVNSMNIAMEFHQQLPVEEAPEHTEGHEGFYHLLSFHGDVEETLLNYIIRDFDREQFERRKETVRAC